MIRLLLILLLSLALPAAAQDTAAAPRLTVDFPETEAVPGQPLSLRLTVLVPTFMPEPPVWPSLETPNLLVRLPSRSTGPVSERIDGETWSGVSRHYRISPMVPGPMTLPPQEVVVTWQDLEASDVRQTTLTTEAVSLASGGDRRLTAVYALAQLLLPALGFALAIGLPRVLHCHRRALLT